MSRIEYKYIITEFEYEKKPIGGIFLAIIFRQEISIYSIQTL